MSAYETHVSKIIPGSNRPKTEWSSLVDLVPAGFDLLSTKQVAHQAFELLSNAANARRYASVVGSAQATLRSARVPILVEDNPGERPLVPYADLKRTQRRWLGQVVLQLYFAQLFQSDTAVIDLWPSRLGIGAAGDAIWNPRPAHLQSTLRDLSELRLGQPGSLHRNFVAFGLYLASLHELLESLDCTLDVRSAFMRSYRRA